MTSSTPQIDWPLLARVYHAVLTAFVQDGRAPHYVELARTLNLPPEVARQALHQIEENTLANWLVPDTDYIASFAPFSNVPNQYRVSVDGQPRGYAQCGLESTAISWLFPGREVRVDAHCLDCGEPLSFRMRDGALLAVDPPGMVAHSNLPPSRWMENIWRA